MSKAIRALVIEDSERDALLLVRRLERSGFDPAWERVETAESLRAALARQAWDIAFSDHSMRGFGSLDALRIVKEQGLDIPLVILSGAISEEEAVSAMQAGAVDYVRKDNLARLIPVVERELRAGQERRERQQAEAAQRESQARKSAMLDSALDCIVTIDHEGKVFEWNPAAEKTFGYRRGEVIGKELAALVIPPALRERHRQGLARYLSTGQSSILGKRMEMSALRADGTEFPVELSITQVPTEGLPLFTGFIRDITERRQAEETLHATEARLQAMLDNSPNVVFMKDTEGRYVEINRQFEKVFRIDRSQIVGKTDDEVFPREQAAAFRANDALVLQAGVPMEFEETALHADGRHTSIVSKFPLRDANGKIYASCGIATDITERRRLAEQLRQFQKMESIGQLAAGVAHDFNNILAVIQGHTDMVLGGMVAGNDAEESLKQVAAAAKRAANLTRQLLAFSRKQEMQPQDMDLNGVIKDMTRMLERLLGADVALQFIPDPNLPAVNGDVGMMEQVLLNLAVNARDAMPQGGQLIINTAVRTFDETHVKHNPEARAGQFVCLSVQDTGGGIAPEVLPRIFEPFFTTKEAGRGTGLGLATVYGIVKQHQGWLEVESQVGQGTTFNVFLPASAKSAAPAVESISSAAPRGRGETILVAEDEPALRRLAARMLRNLGYEVLEAASGVEAIEVWERHGRKVDLLLTDLVMPDGLTGRELAKKMETHESGLKVIYTSGYSPEMRETAFVFREGTNFLQKPYEPHTLAKAVRDCLDGKQAP